MAIVPIYCPEDAGDGGPISKARALELLRLMRLRHITDGAKYQSIPSRETAAQQVERTRKLDYHTGNEQALSWAIELLERVFVDPSPASSRKMLLNAAERLERQAESLRAVAGYMEEDREGKTG